VCGLNSSVQGREVEAVVNKVMNSKTVGTVKRDSDHLCGVGRREGRKCFEWGKILGEKIGSRGTLELI
jgi:hypothetical protein